MEKEKIEKKIESFIYGKLKEEYYTVNEIKAKKLLVWNRLDLAFRLFYLENRIKNKEYAEKVYFEVIKAQTLGSFKEIDHKNKNSFNEYRDSFEKTFNNIKELGFDKNKSLVPLSKEGQIINGAHRLASCIFLNKKVHTITTEQGNMIADWKYFYERNVQLNIIEEAVKTFIEYSNPNVYIAFLWPSGRNNIEESKALFNQIIYEKKIELTSLGTKNLLKELYKHMNWIGSKGNRYQGLIQKSVECFPTLDPTRIIIFQEESISKVKEIKKKVREINKIGYSSIHITDTKEEAMRISKLILNRNGINFLNNAPTYNLENNKLMKLNEIIKKSNISKKDIIISGSMTLELYNLRKSQDIDYLKLESTIKNKQTLEIDDHSSQLKYYPCNIKDLIINQEYYFEYMGVKFISIDTLYTMKLNRSEVKDINDCNLIKYLKEKKQLKNFYYSLKQKILYFKIKHKNKMKGIFIKKLKEIHLYFIARKIFRTLKSLKKII